MSFIIVFGGNSYEHEISIVSAITLSKNVLDIYAFVFIDAQSNCYLIPKENMKSNHFSSLNYKKNEKVRFINGGFEVKKFLKSRFIEGIVINLIHGKSGEDGELASLFEFYNINYIGPRIEASAISFNKELTKIFAKSRDVRVLDYEVIRRDNLDSIHNLESKLPFILKPARLGSSIGISIVKNAKDIEYMLDNSFEFDSTLILERFVSNVREYNLAGFKSKNGFVFSIIEEVQKNEYLNFDKKYLDFGRNQVLKEAQISDCLKSKLKDAFMKIYDNCFEGALIRCDFFVIDNEVYLNEINPIPGSLAYYLFEDFEKCINSLALNLPKLNRLNIKYKYISKIQSMKGK